MVQAILSGEKTMTRRIKGLDEINKDSEIYQYRGALPPLNTHVFARMWKGNYVETVHINCPYGKPGDHLWVRETFAFTVGEHEPFDTLSYKADNFHRDIKRVVSDYPESEMCLHGWYDEDLSKEVKWRPSIHMPKAIARIWIEVEEVRVERLFDISDEDIKAEGVRIPVNNGKVVVRLGVENSALKFLPQKSADIHYTQSEFLFAFWAELWCKINGRANLDANPWVWVVKFRKILNNGNEMQS